MKNKKIVNVILAVMGLALSLFLAVGGDSFRVPTPGVLAAKVLAPPQPYPNQLNSLGDSLRIQMFVDWIFWLVVMYLIYFLIKKLSRRFQEPH